MASVRAMQRAMANVLGLAKVEAGQHARERAAQVRHDRLASEQRMLRELAAVSVAESGGECPDLSRLEAVERELAEAAAELAEAQRQRRVTGDAVILAARWAAHQENG